MSQSSITPPLQARRQMIRFNRPFVSGRESTYLAEALAGPVASGNGPLGKRCETLLEQLVGAPRVMMTPSCTHALELSALLLDLKEGDEVIVPSFAFVSTASAFALRGARPVFADIRRDTLNLDESALPSLITDRTRVVVPLHYAGVGCEMAEIVELCRERGVAVVEDNAHGLLGTKSGRPLGTFGKMATLSFHDTKNFSAGEGGALILNDAGLVARAEILREKGTDRAAFFRGQVDKYSWVDLGSSLLPSEYQMAVLLAQLEARDAIQQARGRIWNRYAAWLGDWAAQNGCTIPHIPDDVQQPYHLFYLLLPSLGERQRLIEWLRFRNVTAPFHYVPLHLSRQGRAYGGRPGQCPVSERVSERLIRLPMFPGLTDDELDHVVESILDFEVSG